MYPYSQSLLSFLHLVDSLVMPSGDKQGVQTGIQVSTSRRIGLVVNLGLVISTMRQLTTHYSPPKSLILALSPQLHSTAGLAVELVWEAKLGTHDPGPHSQCTVELAIKSGGRRQA